jgi:hypothetical protein
MKIEKHTMSRNEVRPTVLTSSTEEQRQFPFYYFKLKVYSVQFIFKYYNPNYNITPELYRRGLHPLHPPVATQKMFESRQKGRSLSLGLINMTTY